ncbi:MAG: class I SAM-dependent methyltransferase [Bacteroidota bacterium]|nr:class I SAM-dependent methyltransferase [Bacteroidota bacterium]
MNCKICNTASVAIFKATVLNKYDVQYFSCPNCEYLFTEKPYWLDEAYNSVINVVDTGIMARNILYSRIVSALLFFFFDSKGKFLDYAGGYGIFTRLMRDVGFNFYWNDPFCENLLARGFEYKKEEGSTFDLLTAFEVFEHLSDPVSEIKGIFNISASIIFSTELLPTPIPKPTEWWYYGFDHGQHVSFYTKKTLSVIARQFGIHFYSIKSLHIFTPKKLNLFAVWLVVMLLKLDLFLAIKKNMKSKTWDDHFQLKNN